MNLLWFFFLTLKASLFSTGGLGNVPSLHADLLARKMATEQQFASSLSVGQLSPGPNGLWVVALGFAIGGIPGALVSIGAICIPAGLVLVLRKTYERHQGHLAVEGFVWGLSLATAAAFSRTMASLVMLDQAILLNIIIAAAACVLALRTRIPVIVIIAAAALFGIFYK